jgi:cephalosporin-C deacetylase-like acetyl esterase
LIPLEDINKDTKDVPIYIYSGLNDDICSPEDSYWVTMNVLGVKKYREFDGFDHGTFAHFHDHKWFAGEILEVFEQNGIKPIPTLLKAEEP